MMNTNRSRKLDHDVYFSVKTGYTDTLIMKTAGSEDGIRRENIQKTIITHYHISKN